MHSRRFLTALLISVGVILAACTPAWEARGPLDGTDWLLADLGGQAMLPDTRVTLRFADGQISGTDGCNEYGAAYTLKGAKLSVNKHISATQMACAEPIMQQAARYVAALTQSTEYTLDGQQLRLLDARGQTLATLSQDRGALIRTDWLVTGYESGKQGVVSVLQNSQITLRFHANGTIGGRSGINLYDGSYGLSGNSLTIGGANTYTLMSSLWPAMWEQEGQYLKALRTVVTYRMEGNQLAARGRWRTRRPGRPQGPSMARPGAGPPMIGCSADGGSK
jgi:heat shock protein HslJ